MSELIISVSILHILSSLDMNIVFMFESIWTFKRMSDHQLFTVTFSSSDTGNFTKPTETINEISYEKMHQNIVSQSVTSWPSSGVISEHRNRTQFKRRRSSEGKRKCRLWVLQHCCLEAYCTLTRMSSFIHLQRLCTHQGAWETSASEGRNYTWNLASNP